MKINTKLIVPIVLVVVLVTALAVSQAYGQVQGGKSSYSDDAPMIISPLSTGPSGGDPVAIAKIRTGEHSDIAILFTAEAALFTDTKIVGESDSKGSAKKVTDTDRSTIQVYATVDGVVASPGMVTFADRYQELSGVLDYATWNSDGYSHDDAIPEEIQLILETTNCNGFNFMAEDISNGEHTIIIYAVVDQSEHTPPGFGAIGQRSLILQEMKLVNY